MGIAVEWAAGSKVDFRQLQTRKIIGLGTPKTNYLGKGGGGWWVLCPSGGGGKDLLLSLLRTSLLLLLFTLLLVKVDCCCCCCGGLPPKDQCPKDWGLRLGPGPYLSPDLPDGKIYRVNGCNGTDGVNRTSSVPSSVFR